LWFNREVQHKLDNPVHPLNSGYISLALYSALLASAVLVNPIAIGAYAWGLTTGGIRKHPALEVQPSKRDVNHRR